MIGFVLAAALCQLALPEDDEPAYAEIPTPPAVVHVHAIEHSLYVDAPICCDWEGTSVAVAGNYAERFICWSFSWDKHHQKFDIVMRGYCIAEDGILTLKDDKPTLYVKSANVVISADEFLVTAFSEDRVQARTGWAWCW